MLSIYWFKQLSIAKINIYISMVVIQFKLSHDSYINTWKLLLFRVFTHPIFKFYQLDQAFKEFCLQFPTWNSYVRRFFFIQFKFSGLYFIKSHTIAFFPFEYPLHPNSFCPGHIVFLLFKLGSNFKNGMYHRRGDAVILHWFYN